MTSRFVSQSVMRCVTAVWILSLTVALSISTASAVPLEPLAGLDDPGAQFDPSAPLPLSFIPNVGQTASEVQFQASGMGGSLYFTDKAVTFLLPGESPTALSLEFTGANASTTIQANDRLPGIVNYLIGSDPSAWHTRIPTYATIQYADLYPGIDLRYEGLEGALKGTYTVASGADASVIGWHYSGANHLQVDTATGDLQIVMPNGQLVTEKAPIVWQTIDGQQIPVAARYKLLDQQIGFDLGSYNTAYPLIIDPILLYSTFIGGSGPDDAWGIATDGQGNAYVTGRTESSNFPHTIGGGLQGQRDAFVVKINTNASGAASLVWSTYLGGAGGDDGWGIAADSAGNVYVTGTTGSDNFPHTASGFQQQRGQGFCCSPDAYLIKLGPDGSTLLYGTFIGGLYNEDGYGVAVDSSFNAYITGNTNSENFPVTASAFQLTNPATPSGPHYKPFLTKIDTTASGAGSLVYSTYFGAASTYNGDSAYGGIAADDAGNAYISGRAENSNFPVTANAYQTTIKSNANGAVDAYIARFDTTQSGANSLVYSTFFGGTGVENFNYATGDISTDGLGVAYITGETTSLDLPTRNAYQSIFGGGYSDVFVAKIDTNASGDASLLYSSYVGGNDIDQGYGIAATRFGNIYITGQSRSANFPLLKPIHQANAGFDGSFVSKIDTTLIGKDSLIYSTFLGGSGNGFGGAAVDSDGTAYVAGQVSLTSFPIVNGFQPTYAGNADGYMAKLAFRSDLDITKTVFPDPAPVLEDMTITLEVKGLGPETATGVIVTEVLPPTVDFVSAVADAGTCSYATQVVTCLPGNILLNDIVTITITVIPQPSALFAPPGQQFVSLMNDMNLGLFAPPNTAALLQGGEVTVTADADAVEKDLNAANSTITKNVGVFDFTALVPTLLNPSDTAHVTNNPITVSWNPIPSANHYVIQFGSSNPPQTIAAVVNKTSYTFPSALPIGTSYWRVQGVSAGSQVTQWSAVNTINIDSLVNAAPAKNFGTALPTLTWNRRSGALGYQIQVDNQAGFGSPEYENTAIPADQLSDTVTNPLPSGTYYWHVRAKLSATTWSVWSAAETIVVNAP